MKPDPQTQALNVMIEEALSQGKPWSDMEPQELRDQLAQGGPLGPPAVKLDDIAQERTIPGPAGEIPVRVFIPPVVRLAWGDYIARLWPSPQRRTLPRRNDGEEDG